MASREDSFEVTTTDGVMVVNFTGSGFLDEEKLDLVGGELLDAVTAVTTPRVVLDMSNIRFCSSSIIGKFVALYKNVVGLGGEIKFANVEKPVLEVFRDRKSTRLNSSHYS